MRVALAVRVSTQEQSEKGTIQTQVEFLESFCQLKGWVITERYVDEGVSGTTPVADRVAGARLLRDCHRKKFDAVLVYKLDRLGRSVKVVYDCLQEFEECGIGFISATEPFDTTSPLGRLMLGLMAIFAAWERELIKERSSEGRKRIVREGRWSGGVPPYGFLIHEGRLAIDDEPLPGLSYSEAEIVRLIFRWIGDDGISLNEAQRRLNGRRIPNPRYSNAPRRFPKSDHATTWTVATLSSLIHNPAYCGEYHWGKWKGALSPMTVDVPPIVTPEQWRRAQEVPLNHRAFSVRNSKRSYLLKRMIRCGSCGHTFTGMAAKDLIYYRCQGRFANQTKVRRSDHRCTAPYLNGHDLEAQIWADLQRFASRPQAAMDRLVERINGDLPRLGEVQAEADHLTAQIEALDLVRTRFRRQNARGLLDDDGLDKELAEVQGEEDALRRERAERQQMIDTAATLQDQLATTERVLAEMQSLIMGSPSEAERQQIIRQAVPGILVQPLPDGQWEVVVHYCFAVTELSMSRHQKVSYNGFSVPYPARRAA